METPAQRGRRLGRRYTVLVFGLLASLFMIATTQQLIFGVFGVDARPLARDRATGSGGASCAEELRGMQAAIDRAILASAHAERETEASLQFQRALLPEWGDGATASAHCASTPNGTDALATVVRLRVAGEQLARRHAHELAPLRQDVASYLAP
jgi:hypothetical protein